MQVREYITTNWNVFKDDSGFIPYPYVPPCFADGKFTVLFYWDTFFTNEGLIADGRIQDARYNVDNLMHFLYKFGCVPNMTNAIGADYASQPPLLYMMVKSLMQAEPNAEWECKAMTALEKEYTFWMTERTTPCGLNRHGTNMKDEKRIIGYYNAVCSRISLPKDIPDDEKIRAGISAITEAESGEDFTPRFSHRAYEYAPVDLNAHLYGLEELLQTFYADKDKDKASFYEKAKAQRAMLMKKFMMDKDGVYHDYRYIDDTRSEVYACGCFVPYMVGLTKDGIEIVAKKLQTEYGFTACEDLGKYGFQWGYPYVWAPHQYFAFKALNRVGKNELAKINAKRFLNIVDDTFAKTGSLWERYEKDGVAKSVEYKTQIMLGWTAGTYNVLYDALQKEKNQ